MINTFLDRQLRLFRQTLRQSLWLGLLIFAIGFTGALWRKNSVNNLAQVETKVVSIRENDQTLSPVFETTFEGKIVRHTSQIGMSSMPHKVGDTGPGYYDPKTGRVISQKFLDAQIRFWRLLWLCGALVFIQGVVYRLIQAARQKPA